MWCAGVMLTPIVVWVDLLLYRLGFGLPWPTGYMNVLWPGLLLAGMSVSGYAVAQSGYGRAAKSGLLVLTLLAVLFVGFVGLASIFLGVRD
jgi:hypothetical protein